MSSRSLNQTGRQKLSVENSADEIDLAKLFGILLDSKWLIILITTLFSVLGILYALLATPIYKADALIQVEQKSSGMSALVGDMGDIFSSESSATTEIEILTSRMILGQTVDKLNLTTLASPSYIPVIGKGLARIQDDNKKIVISRFDVPRNTSFNYKLIINDSEKGLYSLYDDMGNKVLSGTVNLLVSDNNYNIFIQKLIGKEGDEFQILKRSKLDAIQWLNKGLSVNERGKQTGILQISFEGENKNLIEDILNDISQNYFLQNVDRNSAEAEKSLNFLEGHLPNIKTELTAAEDVLNRFRQKSESIDLGLEAQSTLKVMVELEAQLNELTFKESEISKRFTKDHPAYKSLLDKRKVLLGERDRLNKQVQKLPKTQREVLRMTRDVEVNQQIYIQLLNKTQELNILKAGTVGNVRIIDSAQSYTRAVKPKKPLIVVLATLLGGMLAVVFVLLRAALHKGVENPDDVEALGLPVYANIPMSEHQIKMDVKLKQKSKNRKPTKKLKLYETLLAEANPADLTIEAFRSLRTSMHFAMMEAKNNLVMISGPAPGVGKSFVSANFASVIAKAGQKVLLIDGDMRKGYLQKHFNLDWHNGLSELLSGKLSVGKVIKPSGVINLDVITRGQIPPNPSELLMNNRFSEFIEWASSEYDIVLIDTPPILAVTDPSIVGAFAGTTLMVGRFGKNTVKEIDVARQRFDMAGIDVKGFILNAVEKKPSASYGYGYYNYSYESDKI
ncbi:chain length regulator (capsular polysaccharide biosynthesis) [Marinomonas sp. MED121]|uniref:polysaccharide biosynthesis tyrosine autokinase n=1 Tax=Marinomonas sp. MED121 TaxID=314277 RepID=UPI0000690B4E|nr:polysaccharide biosynthesis tyrosine autokinase [Marinomonas sp. MED121]EAQ66015.1 chain length regulator (capsular polysaccharide biosynthesis) [Marinomonas sp. MED121]